MQVFISFGVYNMLQAAPGQNITMTWPRTADPNDMPPGPSRTRACVTAFTVIMNVLVLINRKTAGWCVQHAVSGTRREDHHDVGQESCASLAQTGVYGMALTLLVYCRCSTLMA